MENVILEKYFKGLTIENLIQPNVQIDLEQKRVIEIINNIEKTMKVYASKITYTQMRNIYAILISANNVIGLHKVRPKIAYIQARLDKPEAKHITIFIMEIMKEITELEQVKSFKELMQTMVAFHKQFSKN
jgi:CRISPR type III-A-associated protein Csm2